MCGVTGQEPEIVDGEVVEPAAPPLPLPAPDYDEHGVPSFDYVRDRIEQRSGTAIGHTELAGGTEAARSLDEQAAERERKAAEKLAEIRRSLGGGPA